MPAGLHPHELRHTAVSLAVSAGANVKAVQRMLGHAKASMTLDVYADLFDDDLEAVADRLDELRAAGARKGQAGRSLILARFAQAVDLRVSGWRRRDLNPQPPPCKGGALPVELRPRGQVPGYRPDGMPPTTAARSHRLLWTERWMGRWTTRRRWGKRGVFCGHPGDAERILKKVAFASCAGARPGIEISHVASDGDLAQDSGSGQQASGDRSVYGSPTQVAGSGEPSAEQSENAGETEPERVPAPHTWRDPLPVCQAPLRAHSTRSSAVHVFTIRSSGTPHSAARSQP